MGERREEITAAIRRRILSGLHLGTLAHGDRLPSTRELSHELGVTPRTVMAAYRELEHEGLVELRPRSGMYVAASQTSGGGLLTQLAGWVVEVLVQALARNVAPIEFPERVRRCLETLRLRAACIADNRDQIHSLCTELHADYGVETAGVELEQLSAPDDATKLALRRADVLVTIALHAAEVQRCARELAKPWIVVSLRPDLMSEVTRRLVTEPVYFVATDPRFGDALRRIFEPTGGHASNLRLVVLGRDDPQEIPDGAPTYIMRSAREQLGDSPLAARVVQTPRVFSTDTARELLTFIIGANIAAMAARAA